MLHDQCFSRRRHNAGQSIGVVDKGTQSSSAAPESITVGTGKPSGRGSAAGLKRQLSNLAKTVVRRSSLLVTELRKTYKTNEVSFSICKLCLSTIISMTLTDWWTYGDKDVNSRVLGSCSNTNVDACHSFCHDTFVVAVTIEHDDFVIDDDLFGRPVVHRGENPYTESYCVANFKEDCAYRYWMMFRLVPIFLHIIGFLLQFVMWWYYSNFTPQQEQFNCIIAYWFPEVVLTDTVQAEEVPVRDFGALLRRLVKRPSDSIFSFLNVITILFVWTELWWPPLYCNPLRPLSLYYYPILISMLDISHFNFFVATRLAAMKEYRRAVLALLNVEMLAVYLTVSMLLSVVFAAGCISDLGQRLYWLCIRMFYCTSRERTEAAWPQSPKQRSAGTGFGHSTTDNATAVVMIDENETGTEMVQNPMSGVPFGQEAC
jgi:hypothetical protein